MIDRLAAAGAEALLARTMIENRNLAKGPSRSDLASELLAELALAPAVPRPKLLTNGKDTK